MSGIVNELKSLEGHRAEKSEIHERGKEVKIFKRTNKATEDK